MVASRVPPFRPTPPQPLALRALNRMGHVLHRLGVHPVRLDEAGLLAEAERRTHLSDFGDDFFREPLRRLVDALEREAALSLLGRVIARRDLLRCLENRLRMTEVMRHHPELLEGPVPAPIFIVGLPRTGTTILHELFAQDPANRVPMTWEVMHPWPPPERSSYDCDPRIAQVERHFAGVDRVLPDFKKMHPMGAQLPQECVALMAHDFATLMHHTTHDVPSYQRWLEELDFRPVYASHRRQLQYLQWRCAAERWVLKSPGHLWELEPLLAVYPDARVVQTHRDPVRVVASLVSLVRLLRSLASERVDPVAIGEDWSARLARGLERSMAVRARGLLPPERVFDLHFTDFVGDEIATVRRIYRHFGLELGGEAEARMERFLADHPRDRHGVHRYELSAAGLDASAERRRYVAYQECFGIAAEAS
jgi:hypothetical protein